MYNIFKRHIYNLKCVCIKGIGLFLEGYCE